MFRGSGGVGFGVDVGLPCGVGGVEQPRLDFFSFVERFVDFGLKRQLFVRFLISIRYVAINFGLTVVVP